MVRASQQCDLDLAVNSILIALMNEHIIIQLCCDIDNVEHCQWLSARNSDNEPVIFYLSPEVTQHQMTASIDVLNTIQAIERKIWNALWRTARSRYSPLRACL